MTQSLARFSLYPLTLHRICLQAFERMRVQGCKADGIVYNAIIDTLWETGVVWAQRRALALFR